MPLDWVHLQLEEKAQAVLDDIEGLDDSEVASLLQRWSDLEWDPLDAEGALAELCRVALDTVAAKNGTPTSRDRAKARLRRRGVIE